MRQFKIFILLAIGISSLLGCRKFLDVNSDPASPQKPDLNAIFPPLTAVMSRMMIFDGRFVGQYTQNFSHTSASENYDIHGGNAGGSGANQHWRDFYTLQGTTINLVIKTGIAEEKWDYVGAALAIRAWGLQSTTDYFGEMPYRQAWEDNRVYFDYDDQEYIYFAVDSICKEALTYLARTDGKVNQAVMGRGDQVYQGNRQRWIKFVYGILARNAHHISNKPNYNPNDVIKYVDLSLDGLSDNFNINHTATRNDDTNPWGPARDNLSVRRQSRFITQLLDGNTFIGNTLPISRDPRLGRLLSASFDTTATNSNMPSQNGGYRFILPASGYVIGTAGTASFRQAPSTLYGDSTTINPAIGNFSSGAGKFLFQNRVVFPIMTYHELQFIKAEAAFRKNDLTTAYTAYRNGINGHIDFVNNLNQSASNVTQITTTERNAYLASGSVKQNAASITITDIMLQKYIGDFGWNFVECWSDMRRFNYFDLDELTGLPVYRNYQIPVYSSNNLGPKPAQRFRPTNFSEFDWNLGALRKIGALNVDYHTYEMWFSRP